MQFFIEMNKNKIYNIENILSLLYILIKINAER